MTLILSALTQHEVIQLSDRRFTFTRGDGSLITRNDERNKTVLFCGRLVFGFAGRGDLGLKRSTDLWLADRICVVLSKYPSADQGALLRGIADEATELFATGYRGQRHAFLGVGWARFGGDETAGPARPEEFQPYLAGISNFHDSNGRELDTVQERFSIFLHMLPQGDGGFVLDVPGHLSQAEKDELATRLEGADRTRSVESLVELLADQVHAVADRDPRVGRGLMISVLPRAALGDPSEFIALAGGPMADSPTFLYIPPSGDTTIQLGPVMTCGGGVLSGFRAEPIPNRQDSPTPPRQPPDPPGLTRRWYLVPVVGSGTDEDPYRAETLGRSASAHMPCRQDGHPRHEVALAVVSSVDHEDLENHHEIYPLADLDDLDTPIVDLSPEKRVWLESVAEIRNVRLDGLARDVIRRVGEQLEPGFIEDGYWVS